MLTLTCPARLSLQPSSALGQRCWGHELVDHSAVASNSSCTQRSDLGSTTVRSGTSGTVPTQMSSTRPHDHSGKRYVMPPDESKHAHGPTGSAQSRDPNRDPKQTWTGMESSARTGTLYPFHAGRMHTTVDCHGRQGPYGMEEVMGSIPLSSTDT